MNLFSSVAGADQERICFHAMSEHDNNNGNSIPCIETAFHHGQLIIAKTYIGDCVEAKVDCRDTIPVALAQTYSSVYLEKGPNKNHKQVRFPLHSTNNSGAGCAVADI